MSKAEKFIEEHTKDSFNYNSYAQVPIPWLTPDQARKAVEIEKEEMIEKVCEYLEPKIWAMNMGDQKVTDECIEDLKQAMKDETENL